MSDTEIAQPANASAAPTALPVEGFRGTPEEIERQWYEQVYRGRGDSMLQLTWRAVLMGSVLGGALSLTNLYIGLKAGWGFGVAITACILSYAIWTALHRAGIVREPMTILENNCMQSAASSAGYSTGGTLISAFAAYMLINNRTMSLPTMLAWVFCLAVLGVTMAIPMKRQMINVEQLRFPSGIAAAETLRALHSVGESGMRSARALGWAGLLAVISKFWTEGLVVISAKLGPYMIGTWVAALNQRVFGREWMGRTVMFSWEPMFIAAQWRTALAAFADLRAMFGGAERDAHDPIAAIETPASWFIGGQLFGFVGLAWLGHRTFGMPYWETAVAVLLSFALALVACRVTGETDTTPVGAMGKITQLTFGAISPGHVNSNLMSANITAAAAGGSADLLTDLKSGYLLGAHPRKQFIAQFSGIFVGTLVSVLWALGPVKIWSIVIGGFVGIALTVLPMIFPARRHLIPSPAGVGLAWTFHWYYGLLFFIGGLVGWWVEKKRPTWAAEYTFPVASGWIAGESLTGVGLVMWENGPELVRKLLG